MPSGSCAETEEIALCSGDDLAWGQADAALPSCPSSERNPWKEDVPSLSEKDCCFPSCLMKACDSASKLECCGVHYHVVIVHWFPS